MEFLNFEQGKKRCMNDEEFYLELVKEFAEESKLKTLQENYQRQDWPQYRMNVHTIKSSAAYIGAEELSQQARLLENAAKEGNQAYLVAKHIEFTQYYQKVLQGIKDFLAEIESAGA
ncbi:MAG: Hpt domain-containing protein [Anaerovibrio sp.]|nr:Hpt domain-containing protein [Anaerovibrio sp.]